MVKLMTPPEVARLLRIKPQSLRVRRMRGQGPPYIRLSDSAFGRVAYPEEELQAWLASRPRFTATGDEKVAASRNAR